MSDESFTGRCPTCGQTDHEYGSATPAPVAAKEPTDEEPLMGEARLFLGQPERWIDINKRRCKNGHVSTMTLKSSEGGRLKCLACYEQTSITYPGDADGDLLGAEIYALGAEIYALNHACYEAGRSSRGMSEEVAKVVERIDALHREAHDRAYREAFCDVVETNWPAISAALKGRGG